ncbi:hypothetical protein RJ639_039051 [Escallonia herrerae]|uniref:N-acetyltransferase domain-containing protein n=1 Tax=Escallonia herrerae TaxID=1293975 RepID=A0AA89B5P2_9ASTE|nr:hypothetical protein RJ639_039051 [Escallonia herrerae]
MERGSSWKTSGHHVKIRGTRTSQRQRGLTVQCCTFSSTTSLEEEVELDGKNGLDENHENGMGLFGNLVTEYGWQVRRMIEKDAEMRKVAQVQAEAFHEPVIFFNDLFFQFFQAEVLSGLFYRLRNSPPDRYACLVAEPASGSPQEPRQELVGVVDVTVLRDEAVLQHLLGVNEYLYVSGIAVLNNFRRQKVASALLKGCDVLSVRWGYHYLALRAYEDDWGARKLYTNAGYRIVSGDPPWMTTWIGRRRRIVMIKRSNLGE